MDQPLAGRVPAIARAGPEPPSPASAMPGAPEPGRPGNGSAEQFLLDAVCRAARSPGERVALVLHLSRLGPPRPQPHHRRIARALLTEAAQRFDGQLFLLGNGDLVLLCRFPGSLKGTPPAHGPASLREYFARLFGADAAEPMAIVSLWPLAGQAELLLAYATEQRTGAERLAASSLHDPCERISTLPVATQPPLPALPEFPELLRRRTGALIARSGGARPLSFRPLFREIALSSLALWARYANPGDAGPDPWLLRHFGQRLDEPLLALIEAALPGAGPIGMAGTPPDFALHLGLSMQAIVKERCAHLFDLCHSIGVPIAIEVSLVEAAAAPELFAAAREVVQGKGFRVVLGGISHQALLLIRAQFLGADLFKLDWSARLARAAEPERGALASALDAIGAERVILNRADNEQAVRWGLGHGIRRFVGHHVEIMLAAGRLLTCPAASGCTLGQCTERAAAATAPGRRFCRNLALLDCGVATATPR